MSAHVASIRLMLAVFTMFIVGCDERPLPSNSNAPANQATSTTASPNQAAAAVTTNDLFFDGKSPTVGEPLEMSPAGIRGTWQAVFKSGTIALRFGDTNDPAWTLDEKGAVRDNPNGAARWTWTGAAGGLNSTVVPWGLDSPPRRGWLSTPGEPRVKDLAEFRLVRDDLLRVKGRIPIPGMEIEIDTLFVKAPGESPWNSYGLHKLTGLTKNELVDASPADDPPIKADSPASFRGDWVARQNDVTVTLHIADHRVLTVRRQGGQPIKLQSQEAPWEWFYVVEYDPAESALRIKDHEASLKLTKGGRLLYRHFGGQGQGGEGGRWIDVLFAPAKKVDWKRFGEFVMSGAKFKIREKDQEIEHLIGGMFVPNEGPWVGFGLVRKPGQPNQYAYLVLIKPPDKSNNFGGAESQGKESDDGLQIDKSCKVKLGKHDLAVVYHASLDPTTRRLASESLKVADHEIKEGQPRVFLLNAADETLVVKPVNVALPSEARDMEKEEVDPEKIVVFETLLKAVESLKKDSSEVREFLK